MQALTSIGEKTMASPLSLELLKIGSRIKTTVPEPVIVEPSSKQSKVTVTIAAAAAIAKELAKRPTTNPTSGLRVAVKSGGCSGLSYVMHFEDAPHAEDLITEINGVKVYCDPKSHVYLSNVTLDFVKTFMKQGFEFRNPQQKSECGCGESFAV